MPTVCAPQAESRVCPVVCHRVRGVLPTLGDSYREDLDCWGRGLASAT